MRNVAIVLVSALALAACDSSPKVEATDASGAEVARKVKESGVTDQFISPGNWQMALTINEMTMPGLSPKAAEHMKGAIGKGHTFTQCLRPEDVKAPKEDMFSGGDESCKYDHFSMGGGKIDITMTCGGDDPRKMTMNGTYGPDRYNMKVSSDGQGKTGQAAMSMKMEMAAKRLGECSAEQLKG